MLDKKTNDESVKSHNPYLVGLVDLLAGSLGLYIQIFSFGKFYINLI